MVELLAFLQILLIDISLAGDNAIAVGMAAAGLPSAERHKAVLAGIIAATVLRIVLAFFAVQLLHVTGLLAAGGLLLLWVSWKMHRDIRHAARVQEQRHEAPAPGVSGKSLLSAITQIAIADVSMSLDNVLAVAGVARDRMWVLVVGLTVSVMLMGLASAVVAHLTTRYPWIAYLGLAVVLYTALRMMLEGGHQLLGI